MTEAEEIWRAKSDDEILEAAEEPDLLRALGAAAVMQSAGDVTTAKTTTGDAIPMSWEVIPCHGADFSLRRAKVPGGWLVANDDGGLTFIPDADHKWSESVS